MSSTVNLNFTSMQITNADIAFSVAQSGTSTSYVFSTPSPVALASNSDVAQFTLDRTDGGSGSGSMLFSLIDSAENNTYQHAMSGFHLQDTSTNSDFWGTAAYSQTASTPAVSTTDPATVSVAVQTSANGVGTVLVINGEDPVTTGATGLEAIVETDGSVVTSSIGSDSTGLNVTWGRWASANTSLLSNDPITLEQAHFISTTNQTPNSDITSLAGTTAGTITYGLIGGSAPTDQDGNVGQYNSASMGVDFGTQQITSTQIDMTIGSGNVVLQNTGGTTIESVLNGGAISLQSSSGLTGEARAVFVGSTVPVNNINVPEGVMSSFGASNSTGTQAVSGAIVLGNPSAQ
ncbi:MAG: hypothetical protein CMI12_04350 [Oceanospirillum sp.]|nr:hypothetical protein [Oceanospirillum sp.]